MLRVYLDQNKWVDLARAAVGIRGVVRVGVIEAEPTVGQGAGTKELLLEVLRDRDSVL